MAGKIKTALCRPLAGVPLWCYAVVLLARGNLYALFPQYAMSDDSATYIDFQTTEFLHGGFSNGRAPVYCVLLDVLDVLARPLHGDGLHLIVLLQILCSFLALFLLADILRQIGIGPGVRCAAVLLYGLYPVVTEWDITIMTESLSLSGSIAFFWCAVRLITAPRLRWGVLAILVCAFLVFLRPQFLTYAAMLLVFFLLRALWQPAPAPRRVWLILAGLAALFFVFVIWYAARFKQEMEIFSLTNATPRQNLVLCIERGYYRASDDPEFIASVEAELERVAAEGTVANQNETWTAMWRVLDRYGNGQTDRLTKACIKNVGGKYWHDTALQMLRSMETPFFGHVYKLVTWAPLTLPGVAMALQYALLGCITVGHAMAAALLEGGVMVRRWVQGRRPPWLHMALFAITATTVYLTYVITCGEYARTMISVIPYLFVLAAMAADWLFRRMGRGNCPGR